ncbi:MAG TPA: flagellar basal body rod protein FlgB [Thermodesulfobacteriota bacterium]|nr:flagellar basal body rod protein FlgB [Thermodesulfobacteriota bacterium]
MGNGLFDKTITLLGNSLDLRATRHKLLTSNIANQETPGYKAVDINFEDELKKRQASTTGSPLERTNPAHIVPVRGPGAGPVVFERATDIESYDNNSVGIEAEMAKLSENSIMYSATTKMLKSKFNLLMTAIKEGGR